MKPVKILKQLTPYLLVCSFSIVYIIIGIVSIFIWHQESVVFLPILFLFVLLAVVLLVLDRLALKKWKQKPLAVFELISLPIFFIIIGLANRKMIIEPAANVQSFAMIEVESKEDESEILKVFPFNRKIKIDSANQLIYLTAETRHKFKPEVQTTCDVYIGVRNAAINGKKYQIDVYSICEGPLVIDELLEKVVEKIKKNYHIK